MTLNDLWLLIRHYAKWVIAVPIVFALLMGGFVCMSGQAKERAYTAAATLTATDPTALLSATHLSNLMEALAQNEIASESDAGAVLAVETDPAAQSAVFTATAASEEQAITAANNAAEQTADSIKEALTEQSEVYLSTVDDMPAADDGIVPLLGASTADRVAALRSCVLTISEANTALVSSSGDVVKYAAAGLVGGLLLIICALALLDSVKRPIKGRADVRAVTDLPVLSEGVDASAGRRLWANIQFCAGEDVRSVCVIPVSGSANTAIEAALSSAIDDFYSSSPSTNCTGADSVEATTLSVVSCDALTQDISSARLARRADAVVLVVRLWDDSRFALKDTLSELALADASVAGIALAKQ